VCRRGRTLVGVVAQTVGATVGAAHALCLRGVEVALADHPGGLVAGELQRGGSGRELHQQGGWRSLGDHDDIVLAQVCRAFPCRHAMRQGAAPPLPIDGEARRRCSFDKRASPLAPGSRLFRTRTRRPPGRNLSRCRSCIRGRQRCCRATEFHAMEYSTRPGPECRSARKVGGPRSELLAFSQRARTSVVGTRRHWLTDERARGQVGVQRMGPGSTSSIVTRTRGNWKRSDGERPSRSASAAPSSNISRILMPRSSRSFHLDRSRSARRCRRSMRRSSR
jgi:hypothetical protein